MALTGITSGDFGFAVALTVQEDGVAQDISSYTTLEYLLVKPDGERATWTASLDGDGSDGVLTYTVAQGEVNQAGEWQIRARIAKTGARLTSDPLTFTVDAI